VTLMTRPADDGPDGRASFAPDFDDEIVAGSCVTHAGEIRHVPSRNLLEGEQTGE
jgi:NAD(P) transhydrogenase subunit alpha